MTPERFEKIRELAKKASHRFKNKCRWAQREEIEQAAMVEMLKAEPKFQEGRGTMGTMEFGAYAWQVAINAARKSVLKASAPVSASHRLQVLKGLNHVSIFVKEHGAARNGVESSNERPELHEGQAWTDEIVSRKQFIDAIRERVVDLVGENGAEFAIAILTDEFRAKEVAEAHGVNPTVIYEATKRIKKKLGDDPKLFEMWRQT